MEPAVPNYVIIKNGKKIFRFIDEKILLAGTAGLPKEKLKRTRLVNSMCAITAFLALSIGFLFYVFTGLLREVFIPAAIEAALFTSIIFLNVKKLHDLASVAVLIVHLACAVYFAFILGPLINVPIILAFLFGLCRLIYDDKVNRGLSMAAIVLALIIIEANGYLQFVKPLDMPESSQWLFRWIALPSFLFFFAMILDYYDIEIKRLYKEVEHFVLKITHDLRHIIYGNSFRIIELKKELNEKKPNLGRIKALVDELSSANDIMSVIVHNVLDSTGGQLKWKTYDETFSLEDLIKNVTTTLSANAGNRGLLITSWYDQELPEYIISDIGRMNTILNNFLSNAIKYADEGTEIRIRVSKDKDHFIIAVSNKCFPIPPDKINYLFEENFTAKADSSIVGNGLGLYFVKRTVEAFNGSYGVSSNEKETTFYVRLRLVTSKKIDIAELTDQCKGAEIYYAEDDAMANMLMSNYLRDLGCNVKSCHNGLEMLTMLDKNAKMPDCFIVDDHMPEMGGFRLLKELKSDTSPFKEVPVIIVTGSAYAEAVEKFTAAKAAEVLIKPFKLGDLKTILSRHLQKRSPVNAG